MKFGKKWFNTDNTETGFFAHVAANPYNAIQNLQKTTLSNSFVLDTLYIKPYFHVQLNKSVNTLPSALVLVDIFKVKIVKTGVPYYTE